ncbi:hypothetical protein CDV31_001014 [Fusarium ambrosium]|uniref:aldehyde dehydrogenase (NAD(+)) n=1 Tax=Fusarium ambrosium TaxID=131363 RepID=A0A428V157_9HYPO|nr:hypothetical protein CDV31_001014 [Fusarium ambrosium]
MELRNPIHALLHEWHRPDILASGRERFAGAHQAAGSVRRKVRCTFDAGTTVCTPCERRGAECIGQHLQPGDHCNSRGQSANYENLSRSLVQVEALSGIYDAFVSSYKALIEEKTELVGNPDDPATLIGPLVEESQFNRGFFVAPTVFLDVPEDAEIMRQETFGLVAIINKFETEEEAITVANDSNYGLMAGIFTKDITRAMRCSVELNSGMVGINAVSTVCWQAPFGGTKESGIGRENGVHAIRSFTEPKTIFVNMNA